jgi:hypothetical protein
LGSPNHPPAGGEKAPAGGRLVIIRENVAATEQPPFKKPNETKAKATREARRERYADQRKAAQIWRAYNPDPANSKAAGKGVTACGYSVIAGRLAEAVRTDYPEGPRASWRNLKRCDLRWVCPCCTHRKSEECRATLNAGLTEGKRRGLKPVMMTLTARHTKRARLVDFWRLLLAAEKKMKTRRAWKALMKLCPGGFAKAVEITWGKHGWHPHFHIVFLIKAATEAEAIAIVEALREVWLDELNKQGLDGTSKAAEEHAFDVCGAAAAGEYVTKWGAAEELTLGAKKVGKAEGLTPWQLLNWARTADTEADRQQAAALWYEFVQVFKGVHQLRQSPDFSEVAEAYEPSETKPEEPPQEVALFLTAEEWKRRGKPRQVAILEAVEKAENIEEAKKEALKVLLFQATDLSLFHRNDDFSLIERAENEQKH